MFALTQRPHPPMVTPNPESKATLSHEVYTSDFQFSPSFTTKYWIQYFYPEFSAKQSQYKTPFLKEVHACPIEHINQQHAFPAWPRRCNIASAGPPTKL